MTIPIENIYYLLCYAWDKLDAKDRISVEIDDHTDILDLLAKVLINGTKILLKRGVDRSYVNYSAEFVGVKGKVEFTRTIKSNLYLKQRTFCTYDEFSQNILTNQILISTLFRLTKTKGLDKILKREIKRVLWMFNEIELIELNSKVFNQIKLNRNNMFYGFLLNVCELIYSNSLPSEQAGCWKFSNFLRDEKKMNKLFESFIRNFYKKEQSIFPTVKSEIINWQFQTDDLESLSFLPQMQTDITLENSHTKIIIDAKFYRQTMVSRFDTEKINSPNLYQLFSYLLNQQTDQIKTHKATGILLYPTTEKEYDLEYKFGLHPIHIKTINLNTNWKNIEDRLKNIIKNCSSSL